MASGIPAYANHFWGPLGVEYVVNSLRTRVQSCRAINTSMLARVALEEQLGNNLKLNAEGIKLPPSGTQLFDVYNTYKTMTLANAQDHLNLATALAQQAAVLKGLFDEQEKQLKEVEDKCVPAFMRLAKMRAEVIQAKEKYMQVGQKKRNDTKAISKAESEYRKLLEAFNAEKSRVDSGLLQNYITLEDIHLQQINNVNVLMQDLVRVSGSLCTNLTSATTTLQEQSSRTNLMADVEGLINEYGVDLGNTLWDPLIFDGSLETPAPSGLYHEGWLTKQGHTVRNWKRRWCVLQESEFSYFKSSADRSAANTFTIDISWICEKADPVELQQQNVFQLTNGQSTYFMYTDTPEEMHTWMSIFLRAIGARRPEVGAITQIVRTQPLQRPGRAVSVAPRPVAQITAQDDTRPGRSNSNAPRPTSTGPPPAAAATQRSPAASNPPPMRAAPGAASPAAAAGAAYAAPGGQAAKARPNVDRRSKAGMSSFMAPAPAPSAVAREQYRALYDADKDFNTDELDFVAGDIITLTHKVNDDWGYGTLNNVAGTFPFNFTERIYV